MRGSEPVLPLSQIFKAYFGSDERDERVRRKLVETLYTHPMSLLVGALCGMVASWTAAAVSGNAVIAAGAALLTAVGATRVALAYWISGRPRCATSARSSGSTRSAHSASRCSRAW